MRYLGDELLDQQGYSVSVSQTHSSKFGRFDLDNLVGEKLHNLVTLGAVVRGDSLV